MPTIVWGAHRIWTKDVPKRLGRTKFPIHITIGEPIHVGPDDDITAVTEQLRVNWAPVAKAKPKGTLHKPTDKKPDAKKDDKKGEPPSNGGIHPSRLARLPGLGQ